MSSICPFSQRTFSIPALAWLRAREREHLVGHVQPVRDAGRGDAAGGQQHVDAAAGAEVEHALAGLELDHRERVATAERRAQRGVRELILLAAGVKRGTKELRLFVGDYGGFGAAAASRQGRVGGRDRGRRVAGSDGLAQIGSPAAQPQLPPAALVSQHAALSFGAQHDSCAAGEQQGLRVGQLSHVVSSSSAPGTDVVVGPQPAALAVDDPGVAELLEVVRQRGLGDVEQRHELADADLAGVLAQDVDELEPNRVAERLGDLGHPDRLLALDVGIDDRLAARLTRGALDLRCQLQIDSHLSTDTY